MKNKTKRLMSGAAALAIAMSLAQTAVFAEGEVDYNFNDQTQTLNLVTAALLPAAMQSIRAQSLTQPPLQANRMQMTTPLQQHGAICHIRHGAWEALRYHIMLIIRIM